MHANALHGVQLQFACVRNFNDLLSFLETLVAHHIINISQLIIAAFDVFVAYNKQIECSNACARNSRASQLARVDLDSDADFNTDSEWMDDLLDGKHVNRLACSQANWLASWLGF
jgi:hypothetical protein